MISESRAGPLQLVDEGDQVIHGRSAGWARSGRVARRGGEGEMETRSRKKGGAERGRRGEADRPAASRRRSLGSSCGLESGDVVQASDGGLVSRRLRELIWVLKGFVEKK